MFANTERRSMMRCRMLFSRACNMAGVFDLLTRRLRITPEG